jgi:3-oxoacyl-(acyl-carrier-protein) synthase
MDFFIRSIASISPFSHPAESPYGNAVVCADPDLSHTIDPKLTRRMSHIIKMGLAAALQALNEAGLQQPDAVITGTAYGCLDDTGVFLKKQVQQNETMLTPTSFIQSTHNTVGGQIGLMLHCHAYNNTFVHRGFSFEHALHDAMMLLEEGNTNHVLAGAVDELTPFSHAILERFGLFKQKTGDAATAKGTIAGEGAAFFVISNQPAADNYASIKNVTTLFKPSIQSVQETIQKILQENELTPGDIDIVINGKNGDEKTDAIYDEVLNPLFEGKTMISFKNESGEYPTASAIGLYKAAAILKQKPVTLTIGEEPSKWLVLYNHYQNIHHSVYLLRAC